MTSAAILIGLNAYPKLLPTANLAQLSGAVHDCQDVAQMLLKHQLIDPNHLYAFVYDTNPPGAQVPGASPFIDLGSIPVNGIVPRGTLADALEKFIPELGDQGVERLFVYLSGHGGDLTMAVPPLSVLLTSDYRGSETNSNQGMLVTDHIQNLVHNAIGIREAIIISDSCRSSLPAGTVTPVLGPAPLFKRATRCLMIKSSVHSTPSTEDDVLDNGRVVGTFTHLFLQELDAALTKTPDGAVYWRDICDAVARQQTKDETGQLLDYQQVTAYPLMQVRPAPPETPPTVPTVTLKPPAPATTASVLALLPNTGQNSFRRTLQAHTVNTFRFHATPIMAFNPGVTSGFRIMMAGGGLPGTAVTPNQQQAVKVVIGAVATPPQPPTQVDLMEIYRRRPLINGVVALQSTFGYLSPSAQKKLQLATQILASEGDPRALERLNDALTEKQWASLTSFLNRQAKRADPLSTLQAPAQADGFTLKVTNVTPTSSERWRVELQVDGADARVKPSTVRVYQHPSQLPAIQDVAFTDGAATIVLFTRFAFTVAVKVDGGPLLKLKLDLRNVKSLPRRPKKE